MNRTIRSSNKKYTD